jgi:flagellar biosynthesis/type III secretory pathway ATPase
MGDIIKFPGREIAEMIEETATTDLLRHCILIAYMQDEINTEILEHLVEVLDAVDRLLEETRDE